MTVAQLVHPVHSVARQSFGLARQSRRAAFHLPRHLTRWWHSCDVALWRSIASGLGLAVVGLALMALAIGAAGTVPPASASRSATPAIVQPAPANGLASPGNPAGSPAWSMQVP